MSETTVRTEDELKQAVEKQIETIRVDNPDLVSKLKNMDRLRKCAPWAAGLALAAVVAFATTPATGPVGPAVGVVHFAIAAPATGLSVASLVTIGTLTVVLGLTCFFAIYNGYDLEIVGEASGEEGKVAGKCTLRIKKNK